MTRNQIIIILTTISAPTILNSLIETLLTIINRLNLRRRRKPKANRLFLLLIINNFKVIVGNLPAFIMILTNPMKKSMDIMPPHSIKTQGLFNPVKVSLLMTSFNNSKGKDKKTHKSLSSTINYQKKSLINSAINLNLNNIIPNIMTPLKSIILAPHLQSPQWGKECLVKFILIRKTLKINFHLFILKRPLQRTNNIWLKLSQDPK